MVSLRGACAFVAACLVVATGAGSFAADSGPTFVQPIGLRLGFASTVLSIASSGAQKAKPPCSVPKGGALIADWQNDPSGNPFCITASTQGINVTFQLALSFAAPGTLSCTELRGTTGTSKRIAYVEARVGGGSDGDYRFDAGRAHCDLNSALAYVLSVEKQSVGNDATAGKPLAPSKVQNRTFVIPWSLLHLSRRSSAILLSVSICGEKAACTAGAAQFVQPIAIAQGSASAGAATDPFVVLQTPTPRPVNTPFRTHQIQLDGSWNWSAHNIVSAAFDQDQSYVFTQRALSQALSLAPLSLPVAGPPISVTQTLQAQSQDLMAFTMPSEYLEDPGIKPLFDQLPFAVSRVGRLASGYAYGYTSDAIKGGAFYGLQAPGWYTSGTTVVVALTTPKPTPVPTPTPTPPSLIPTAAKAPEALPLRPPPPPAPFFESGTAGVPPLQVALVNGIGGSPGKRDAIDALSFEAHVYDNTTHGVDSYAADTVNLYGRLEHDFQSPAPGPNFAVSQFIGESSTFTLAPGNPKNRFFQIRESVAYQQNDAFFSPSLGSLTWLAPLDGPYGHLTLSYASGASARFYSLDLMGFRLTNAHGDLAAQAGWQVSVPLPDFFRTTGWLLTGGSEVQTVSDRMAALEQGIVSGYTAALANIAPATRPQRLGNTLLLSPWLGKDLQLSFSAGYDFGTVTGCGTTPPKPAFQCLTERNDRVVGGVFLKEGNLAFGATDTSTMQGNVTAASASGNLGTAGALPGSITSYITYSGCPAITAAYTNAAFPPGVPLPQQGNTLSAETDYPVVIGAETLHFVFGYFNERTAVGGAVNQSGVFGMVRITTSFQRPAPPCKG